MTYESWLAHFNPNHDPKTGQFSKSSIGLKNLKHSRTSNLDKWGTGPNTNVLYITGYSGSGKSTTANSMARTNDTVIHLDGYSEMHAKSAQNKKFNKYLDINCPKWKRMINATENGDNGTIKRYSKEYWKIVDNFQKAVEKFGRDEYKSGNKVIVEGVQIADDWFAADKSYYADKPVVVLSTNPVTSMKRAFDRDGRGNIIVGLKNLDNTKEYLQWYMHSYNRLNDMAKAANAKKGQEYINRLLMQYGGVRI